MFVYIGTYTHGASRGIYTGVLDPTTGRLEVAETVAAVLENPSFLASDSRRGRLYAVSETDDGSVHAFGMDRGTGRLTVLNSQPSGGGHPCHLSLDSEGRFVLVANYMGGTVALLPLHADGRLAEPSDIVPHRGTGPHPRQERPHAHAVIPDSSGQYALAADLGVDKILLYEIDATGGKLAPHGASVESKPGAGPRHPAFHPNGRWVYVLNELDSSVTAWEYEGGPGRLQGVQTVSALPDDFTGTNTAASIYVHPSGRFLYASNRGHDSLAVFALDGETGRLTPLGHVPAGGQTPRHFAIDPTGAFLLCAHQDSDTVATFAIDTNTGGLTPTGHTARVPSPVCLEIIPS